MDAPKITTAPDQIQASRDWSHEERVVVVGAGPVGCLAALAMAQKEVPVLVLEANKQLSSRLAGEWLHPPGVEVLNQLGLGHIVEKDSHSKGQGFVVFPEDKSEPIILPYPSKTQALTFEHKVFVERLRKASFSHPLVKNLMGARVTRIVEQTIYFNLNGEEKELQIKAENIIAADGPLSIVRKYLRRHEKSTNLSSMAGLLLKGVKLPFEGFGHVIPTPLGTMLVFRVGENLLRVCIDIPIETKRTETDTLQFLKKHAEWLPESLQDSFLAEIQADRVSWNVNQFLPKSFYGRGNIAMVGDAVGKIHSLTASGLTLGFLDVSTLVRSESVDTYSKERSTKSYVPELLSNAFHEMFSNDDARTQAMRQTVYRMWRKSPKDREQTMRLLMGDETSKTQFLKSFFRVILRSGGLIVTEGVKSGKFLWMFKTLISFWESARFLTISALPRMFNRSAKMAHQVFVPQKKDLSDPKCQ